MLIEHASKIEQCFKRKKRFPNPTISEQGKYNLAVIFRDLWDPK